MPMSSNPARTFALVNIALFVLAVASLFWLRHSGWLGSNLVNNVPQGSDAMRVQSDSLSAEDVQPASAAQLEFINEILADSGAVVQEGFALRALQTNEAYYVGVRVGAVDTAVAEAESLAFWLMRGSLEHPRSVIAVNDVAAQQSVASRAPEKPSAGEHEAAFRAVLQYVRGQQ